MSTQKPASKKLSAFLSFILLVFLTALMAALSILSIILYDKEHQMDKASYPIEAELLKVWSKRECSSDECTTKYYIDYKFNHPVKGWRTKRKQALSNKILWNNLRTGQTQLEIEGGVVKIPPIINQMATNFGFPDIVRSEGWTFRIKGQNMKVAYVITIFAFGFLSLLCAIVSLKQMILFLRPKREVL